MKLVTFKVHTNDRIGTYLDDHIVDLNSAYALYLREVEEKEPARRWASALIPPCLKEFLTGGNESLIEVKKVLEFLKEKDNSLRGLDGEKIFLSKGEVRICAPIPRPGKIYCAAGNFYDHATERIKDPEERKAEIERMKSLNVDIPRTFQKATSLVCNPGDPIIKPRNSNKVDYECELAVVIGKKGKYIPKENAYDYVGGYTLMIDVSFRDQGYPTDVPLRGYQRNANWTKGKGMDNAAPMGPCLITRDEIPDPYNPPLKLITRVNGETRQNNDLSWMIVKIPRMVEYLSNGTTLYPGDIIATGTVAGVARSWNGFLKVGDVVECEIQPIGMLRHEVIGD